MVLETLREKKLTYPIFVLSNLGQPEDIARAKQLGAMEYFIKSDISLNDLVHAVQTALV